MYGMDRSILKTMSLSVRCGAFVLLILIPTANAMPSGAPKSACVSMTPGHVDTSAEMSTPPYSLQLERGVTTYTPGQTLKGMAHESRHLHTFRVPLIFAVIKIQYDIQQRHHCYFCSCAGKATGLI